jgi:2-oxoglutarate ferredoxin oxidoreductase subunit beta
MPMSSATHSSPRARDYQSSIKPIWCPGCGHFGVLAALTKALAYLERPTHEIAVVSGIGCSARLPAYLDCYGLHGLHGRALPVASGLKLARPDLCVIAAGGDGDGFSIGGNHFLHACRRDLDLCYLVMDNAVYGMTKGQASPTTAADWTQSALTPQGTGMPPFQPAAIALAAGARFVARGFSADPQGLSELIVRAIQHPGFAFVHILSPCRTYRPEDLSDWKQAIHPSASGSTHSLADATTLVLQDDGFTLGVLYEAGTTRVTQAPAPAPIGLAQIEAELQP